MTRPFAEVLREIAGGRLQADLSQALNELVQKVQETGKKGTIAIKLHVSPNGEGQVMYEADMDAKSPRDGYGRTMFFVDSEGNSIRRDPNQPDFLVKAVPEYDEVTGEIKETA